MIYSFKPLLKFYKILPNYFSIFFPMVNKHIYRVTSPPCIFVVNRFLTPYLAVF